MTSREAHCGKVPQPIPKTTACRFTLLLRVTLFARLEKARFPLLAAMADQTALFKQYETDYCNKSTEISRKIGTIPSLSGGENVLMFPLFFVVRPCPASSTSLSSNSYASPNPDQRRGKTAEIEGDIKSADVVIKSMEMEARSLPPTVAQPLLAKVKEYKVWRRRTKEDSMA